MFCALAVSIPRPSWLCRALLVRTAGFVAFALLVACGTGDTTRHARDTSAVTADSARAADTAAQSLIVDDYGDTLRLATTPARIVSLNPTTTEILFTIGASPQLVGRSQWDKWPDSANTIPELGNAIRPNVEAVLAARPDLVILYASTDNEPAARRLQAAGIATLSLKIDRVAEFDRATRMLGFVTGHQARGTIVADSVAATLARVRVATAHLPKPRVVWPFAYRPAMVVGGGSYLNELITIAGGINIYGALPQPSPTVTLEDVVQRNPDYVLRSADVAETGPLDRSWYAVPAVQSGKLLITDTQLIARPSVQLGMAAIQIANALHPGLGLK